MKILANTEQEVIQSGKTIFFTEASNLFKIRVHEKTSQAYKNLSITTDNEFNIFYIINNSNADLDIEFLVGYGNYNFLPDMSNMQVNFAPLEKIMSDLLLINTEIQKNTENSDNQATLKKLDSLISVNNKIEENTKKIDDLIELETKIEINTKDTKTEVERVKQNQKDILLALDSTLNITNT